VADNETDKSTLYNGSGTPQALVVSVPAARPAPPANGGSAFVVHSGVRVRSGPRSCS
jgi:hypothetical protein